MLKLTLEQASLLMYLETCAVDYGGRVNQKRMNDGDFAQVCEWVVQGLVWFGRIKLADANTQGSYWVKLTEEAWELAHKMRRERAARMWSNRNYRKATEKRAKGGDA